MTEAGTGGDGAGLPGSLVGGVRPQGRALVAGRQGGVVLEAQSGDGSEHWVSSSLQEGGPDTSDVRGLHQGVAGQELGLATNLQGPAGLPATRGMAVGHTVGGDLVAGGVELVDLAVVRPLVRHEERGSDGTAVRVDSPSKQSVVEISVEIIDSIVKGKKNKLRCLVLAQTPRDSSSTETGGKRTIPFTRTSFRCSRIPVRLSED